MQKTANNYCLKLYSLAVDVNSARNRQEILYSLVEDTAKAIGAKACSLMMLTTDGKSLRHSAAHGLSEWWVKKDMLPAEILSEVLTGKSVSILDAAADPRIGDAPLALEEGISSILTVPVKLGNEVRGVLGVYMSYVYDFDDEDVFFAIAAGNLGAIALQNVNGNNHHDDETLAGSVLPLKADYEPGSNHENHNSRRGSEFVLYGYSTELSS